MDLYDDDAFDDSDTIKSGCEFLTSVGDMAIDDSLTLSQNKREKIGEHRLYGCLLELVLNFILFVDYFLITQMNIESTYFVNYWHALCYYARKIIAL